MAEFQAVCVDPKRVHEAWPIAAPFIKTAMLRGDLSDYATLESNVRNGNALLWLAWDGVEVSAAAVTTLDVANGKKFCTIVACGGRDLERWGFLIGDLEKFAKDEGCSSCVIMGRKGWARILPDYHLKAIVLEKGLN
jgi:hypothetical protein